MALQPINKRDIDLQNLPNRLLNISNNFIALVSPYLEFRYGGDNTASPSTITIYAQLSGELKGTVDFAVTGLNAGTAVTNVKNKITLNPSTFAGYSVTITGTLSYGGTTYTSNPMVISKRYTNLLTRLTRTYDTIDAESDGSGYTLPSAANTLELWNGDTKLTTGVTFGIQGETVDNKTVDGLKLTINSTTGAITLAKATVAGWTSDRIIFTLVAKFGVDVYTATYAINKLRKGGTAVDTTAPPSTTNDFTLTSSLTTVFIELPTQPVYSAGHGHDVTLVYAAPWTVNNTVVPPVNNYESILFENAKLLDEFPGTFGSFNSDPNINWKIWLKSRTLDGVASVNPSAPKSITTGQDVTKLVEALSGPNKPFTIVAAPNNIIDGITYEPGTYTTKAFIIDGQITKAKIADLAVDNAKIDNISAEKLTVGNGTVGGNLKSSNYNKAASTLEQGDNQGWFVGKNGYADFHAAVIRGQLTATQINANGLSIYGADGTLVLDAGRSIQNQIFRYVPDATSGTGLNMDPTCSLATAWSNILNIGTQGSSGQYALSGRLGEHLVEGAPNDTDDVATKAFKFTYDPTKRYQISALIRKTGVVTSTAATHLGLLEFDASNVPRYNWGGYLFGKIIAANITDQWKRYYIYLPPGSLNPLTVKAALHVILGYTGSSVNNYPGLIQLQDVRVDDVTIPYNIYLAGAATAATDSTTKSNYAIATASTDATTKTNNALTTAKKYSDDGVSALDKISLKNQVDQVIKSGFYLRTNGFNAQQIDGVEVGGTGFALYDGGLIARKNGVNTLAITSGGDATFSGTLSIDSGTSSRMVIKNDKLEVWNAGVRRVVLGNLA